MKNFFKAVLDFIVRHKKAIIITASILVGVAAIVVGIVFAVINSRVKIVYQPANACQLFTLSEAQSLIGSQGFKGNGADPVITGNTAVSSCSYSDLNVDQTQTIVAALSIRSGINDMGVTVNKSDFAASKPTANVQDVPGVGDSAYFNTTSGQLNVLKGKRWYIMSYGTGASPEQNTVANAVKMADLVLK